METSSSSVQPRFITNHGKRTAGFSYAIAFSYAIVICNSKHSTLPSKLLYVTAKLLYVTAKLMYVTAKLLYVTAVSVAVYIDSRASPASGRSSASWPSEFWAGFASICSCLFGSLSSDLVRAISVSINLLAAAGGGTPGDSIVLLQR